MFRTVPNKGSGGVLLKSIVDFKKDAIELALFFDFLGQGELDMFDWNDSQCRYFQSNAIEWKFWVNSDTLCPNSDTYISSFQQIDYKSLHERPI